MRKHSSTLYFFCVVNMGCMHSRRVVQYSEYQIVHGVEKWSHKTTLNKARAWNSIFPPFFCPLFCLKYAARIKFTWGFGILCIYFFSSVVSSPISTFYSWKELVLFTACCYSAACPLCSPFKTTTISQHPSYLKTDLNLKAPTTPPRFFMHLWWIGSHKVPSLESRIFLLSQLNTFSPKKK